MGFSKVLRERERLSLPNFGWRPRPFGHRDEDVSGGKEKHMNISRRSRGNYDGDDVDDGIGRTKKKQRNVKGKAKKYSPFFFVKKTEFKRTEGKKREIEC